MDKQIEKFFRLVLIFWALYLLFESALYLFHIRLTDPKNVWPISAVVYGQLIEKVLGSTFLFVAVIIFEVQKNLLKYKTFIKLSGIWAFFHGLLLIFLSTTQNYEEVFKSFPSLFVWFPLYENYVFLEGVAAVGFSILVYLWLKNEQK